MRDAKMNEGRQIHNAAKARQLLLFDGLYYGKASPTDIDGIIEFKDRAYIIFEVKYMDSTIPEAQRILLERLVLDAARLGKRAIAIAASHTIKDPEQPILLAGCTIKRIYTSAGLEWWAPARPMLVIEFMDKYMAELFKDYEDRNIHARLPRPKQRPFPHI